MDDIGAIQLAVKVDYKELTGLMKTTGQTKRAVSLLAKDFARTRDLSKYMSGINQIVTANKSLGNSAGMTRKQIMSLGAKVQQETKYTDALTAATQRLNVAQMNTNKVVGNTRNKMNGSNMAIQQLGYQFGDFAVQVQGGTSAFVAFSQQGSQLAGILPMIAGPLGLSMGAAVGLSAALGILIPIGSAVGRMFFEMRDSAKDAAEKTKDLKTQTDELIISLREANELRGLGGAKETSVLSENAKELLDLEKQLNAEKLRIAPELEAIEKRRTNSTDKLAIQKFQGGQTQKDIVRLEEKSLTKTRDALQARITALKILINTKKAQKDLVGDQTLENRNLMANEARKREASEKRLTEVSSLAEQEKLLGYQMIAISAQAREKRLKDVSEVADAERLVGQQMLDAINERIKKERALQEERKARAFKQRFAGEESLMSMPLTVDKATQKKIDDAVELNQKQDDFLAKQKVQLGIATRISGQTGEELFAAQQINEMVLFKLELDRLELKSGDEKYNQLVAYKELMQEAEARTFYRIQLEKEAAEAKRIADEEAQRVNDILLDQYARIEAELEDQAQKQKELADTIANTFGDAFMSIVDGTKSAKDAFRDMARDIIKQLYRILVVEQMVNSISGAIQSGFGGGGAPQGPMPSGNVVPDTRMFKLANGGVIGGPTSFRTSSGQSGLMGEAGPEAIMPLKRGANGKLGVQMEGGGATTVVQNFNFSANGDDSVKRIIAQAAPKIAQMTKSEIINDRRRGGTMKATFG